MEREERTGAAAEAAAADVLVPGHPSIPEAVGMPAESDEAEDEGAGEEPAQAGLEPGGRDLARAVSVVESLLLVSARPLSLEKIAELAGGLSRVQVREVVRRLRARYDPETSGIVVEEVAKGLQFRTNPANQDHVRRLFDAKPPRFSRAALETLAIVAYKQPVTRAEIEQIRGVDCAAPIRTLMERRLIRVTGKKDVPGKPFLFGTSREFLEVFGLSALSDLPSLRDIEDYLAVSREASGGGAPTDGAEGAPVLEEAAGTAGAGDPERPGRKEHGAPGVCDGEAPVADGACATAEGGPGAADPRGGAPGGPEGPWPGKKGA